MTNSVQRSFAIVQAAGGAAVPMVVGVRVCSEKGARSRASANHEPKRMRRRYSKRSAHVRRAEGGQDAVAIMTTQLERGVIVEHDVEIAVPARADFADPIEVDQRRSMDPREP